MDPPSTGASSGSSLSVIGSYYHKLYAEFVYNSMASVRQQTTARPQPSQDHQQLHRQFSLRERGERGSPRQHLLRCRPTKASDTDQEEPAIAAATAAAAMAADHHSTAPLAASLTLHHHLHQPQSSGGAVAPRRLSVSSSAGDSGFGIGGACSLQQYRSRHDYLYAMTEDLADWLNFLYDRDITVASFFDELDTGVLLCNHACQLQLAAAEYFASRVSHHSHYRHRRHLRLPAAAPRFRRDARPGGFQARDNVAQFIAWCRQLGLPDCLLFETEDLVARKNTRHVVLCLLEVARAGATFGVEVPELVRFEREIDNDDDADNDDDEEQQLMSASSCCSCCDSGLASPAATAAAAAAAAAAATRESKAPPPQSHPAKSSAAPLPAFKRRKARWQCDLKSLEELVRELISECTCGQTFPMKRLDEGKYLFGDSQMLIFVRVLRNHVMVRVGGGWDSLEHLLLKHDPCRASHGGGVGGNGCGGGGTSKSGVPVNHQEERLRRQQQQQQQQQQQLEQEQQLQEQKQQQQQNEQQQEQPKAKETFPTDDFDDALFVRPLPPPPLKQKKQQKQKQQQPAQSTAARRQSSGVQREAILPLRAAAAGAAASVPTSPRRRASLQPQSSPSRQPPPHVQRPAAAAAASPVSRPTSLQQQSPAKPRQQQLVQPTGGSQSCRLPRKQYHTAAGAAAAAAGRVGSGRSATSAGGGGRLSPTLVLRTPGKAA